MWAWLDQNWFNLVQTIGIVFSLLFSGYAYVLALKSQRVTNTFQVMQYHREIWSSLFDHPELERVLDNSPAFEAKPLTEAERLFVTLLVLHLGSVHRAMNHNAIERIEGLELDIYQFFRLPIPALVWREIKVIQNADFVEFVEKAIAGKRQNDLRKELPPD